LIGNFIYTVLYTIKISSAQFLNCAAGQRFKNLCSMSSRNLKFGEDMLTPAGQSFKTSLINIGDD